MTDVYSDESEQSHRKFLVCKKVSDLWQIVASHNHYELAEASKNFRMKTDLLSGATDVYHRYKIFHKDMVTIKENA